MSAAGGGDRASAWFESWRQWTALFGAVGASSRTDEAGASASAASGFARAYVDFGNALIRLVGDSSPAEINAKLLAALSGRAGPLGGNEVINAFLRAVPAALLASAPNAQFSRLASQWSTKIETWLSELLALPAIGPQREWVEQIKSIQRTAIAEQSASATLQAHYGAATDTALHDFAAYLADESGAPISSLRGLYDAWVSHAETAYSTRVMTADFARDFALWVDAGSMLRLAVRALGERVAAVFDLPQRAEMDALLTRQKILERDLAAVSARSSAFATEPALNTHAVTPERSAPPNGVGGASRPAAGPEASSSQIARKPTARKSRKVVPTSSVGSRPSARQLGEFDIERILVKD